MAGSIASGRVTVTAASQPTDAEAIPPPRMEEEEPCMEQQEPEPPASDETSLAKIMVLLDAEHLAHSKCIAKIAEAKTSIKAMIEMRRKMSFRR